MKAIILHFMSTIIHLDVAQTAHIICTGTVIAQAIPLQFGKYTPGLHLPGKIKL